MADKLTGQPCAIILTAIRVEYMAVRSHLSQLYEDTHPRGSIYECGIFQAEKLTWKVVIMEIGAGNTPPAVEAERAIERFDPELIFFVGVAGGLKDVALGDVVVATKVYSYESGKADESFLPRPGIGLTSYSLERRARAEGWKHDWLQRLGGIIPDPAPRVFIAPIAAGEKVVSSTRSVVYKLIQTTYGDALAVEMEGYGFLQAAHVNEQVHAIVIRGISDLIDDKKEADAANTQELAARHASAFAFEILAKYNLEKTFEDFTKSQRAIKDIKDKVDGKWKERKDTEDNVSQNRQFGDSSKLISKTLKNEHKNVTFFPEREAIAETIELPKTEEALTEWFYALGDYEQYYVLTTAVLHGASVREIVEHTESLYQFIHYEVERRGNLIRMNSRNGSQSESQIVETVRFSDPLLRTISGKELRRITFTETRMKRGVECLYWQDADQYGLSTFGLHLLEFLCKEYIVKAELGEFFLNALHQWSEEKFGEVNRRANLVGELDKPNSVTGNTKQSIDKVIRKAIEFEESIEEVNRKVIHSYGVVLWCHDAKKLRSIAKSWAIYGNLKDNKLYGNLKDNSKNQPIIKSKPISTAELLDGAYEIYKVKSEEKTSNIEIPSVVLPLLKNWIKHIHKVLSKDADEFEFEKIKPKVDARETSSEGASVKLEEKHPDGKKASNENDDKPAQEKQASNENDDKFTDRTESERKTEEENDEDEDEFSEDEFTAEVAIKLGYAVASTYALIGKRSPDIALEGLERLLKLPLSNTAIKEQDINRIYAAGVSAYVILSWSGHVRDVIEHLAISTEQLSHSRNQPLDSKKRQEYRRQRAVYLEATLEAFFLIALASSADVQKVREVQYSLDTPLLPQPAIPDPAGSDVLLAFLISRSEERCQEYITMLLCAAIIERKSRDAFGLLRYWAEIVLQLREARITDAEEIYRIYLQFIVKLGRTVENWCHDLQKQKLFSPPAFETYKNKLKQWCTEGVFYSHPIGTLAREALEQLSE